MSQAIAVARDSLGGQAAFAHAIGRPEETVSDWANGKSLVDPELVVEHHRGVAPRGATRSEPHLRRAMTNSMKRAPKLAFRLVYFAGAGLAAPISDLSFHVPPSLTYAVVI
jgi:hypothetical protein